MLEYERSIPAHLSSRGKQLPHSVDDQHTDADGDLSQYIVPTNHSLSFPDGAGKQPIPSD